LVFEGGDQKIVGGRKTWGGAVFSVDCWRACFGRLTKVGGENGGKKGNLLVEGD